MQFDLTGFLIFLGFILPGFVAQKARDSITPRPLKPQSLVADVGEFVLAGVWVHVLLLIAIRVFFFVFCEAALRTVRVRPPLRFSSQFPLELQDFSLRLLPRVLGTGVFRGMAAGMVHPQTAGSKLGTKQTKLD